MPNSAPQDATQHVSATVVGRKDTIGQQECRCARVIGDHAETRRIDRRAARILRRTHSDTGAIRVRDPDSLLHGRNQRREEIGVEVVADTLHHGRDALESRTSIHARRRQWDVRAIGLPVELHEHEIPDLDEPSGLSPFDERVERKLRQVGPRPLAARTIRKRPVARRRREIDENLGARPARPRVGHLPEVVLRAQPVDAALGYAGHVFPQLTRFVILVMHRDTQMLTRDLQLLGDEVPGEPDRIALEIVAEREIAEHLEEGVVPGSVADLFEIVVLATRSDTLLRRRRTPARNRLLLPQEDTLERHHTGVREHQRRVVRRHQGRRRADDVALALEVGQESGSDLGREHRRQI